MNRLERGDHLSPDAYADVPIAGPTALTGVRRDRGHAGWLLFTARRARAGLTRVGVVLTWRPVVVLTWAEARCRVCLVR
jgi:hypothetical protein